MSSKSITRISSEEAHRHTDVGWPGPEKMESNREWLASQAHAIAGNLRRTFAPEHVSTEEANKPR